MSDDLVELDDVTLHVRTSGPSDGPLALCLHGFPDSVHTFRHLAPHLVERGYRVAVPSMRGYAPSSISKSSNYQLVTLASDALAIHQRLGGDERALIIGHDWGASAVYVATNAEPARWARAVTMAVPPLMLFAQALSNYDQLRLSWYMFYFQQPNAEETIARDDFAFLRRLWLDWSPNYSPDEDLVNVRSSLGDREHLSAALDYYRAMFSGAPLIDPSMSPLAERAFAAPSVPTLYLQGNNDGCIAPSDHTKVLEMLSAHSKVETIQGAGHFLHLERPEVVHRAIDAFLDA
ncbi:MAG TPA: alpha/beta hydrolase [Acidimicrobiales bacterium]